MANYDPQNLESVMVYMRQEFGASVFRDAPRMYAIFCDLSPKLKPYGKVFRELAERGAFAELEAASGDRARQDRALNKARYALENELLLSEERAAQFLDALCAMYGAAKRPRPPQPAPTRTPQPAPPSPKIIKRGKCGDNVTYTLDENGVLTISGKGAMWDFEGAKENITYNTPWRDEHAKISHVEIKNGVTRIGYGAFNRVYGALRSVNIPDSMTSIGFNSFVACRELTSVNIPNGVTTIEIRAFCGCVGLKRVTIPDSVKYIGNEAFHGCENLTSVSVPAKAEIHPKAFPATVCIERRA